MNDCAAQPATFSSFSSCDRFRKLLTDFWYETSSLITEAAKFGAIARRRSRSFGLYEGDRR